MPFAYIEIIYISKQPLGLFVLLDTVTYKYETIMTCSVGSTFQHTSFSIDIYLRIDLCNQRIVTIKIEMEGQSARCNATKITLIQTKQPNE